MYIRFWQMYYVTVVTFDLEFCEIFLPSQKPFYCLTQAHWWCNGPLKNEIDKQTKNFSEERDLNLLPISACFSLLIISSGICSIWWFIVFLTYDFLQESKLWLMILLTKNLTKKRGGDLHVNLDRWLHKFNFSNSAHLWVQTVKHCHVPGIHHKWYKFVLPWHVLRWFCSTWVANWAYIGPRWGNGYCFVKANIKLGSSGWLWGLYTWLQHWNYGEWTD